MKRAGSLLTAVVSAVLPVLGAAGGAVLLSACATCQSTVRVASVAGVAGASFDGADIDQATHRVFLADRTNTAVAVVDVGGAAPRAAGAVKLAAEPSGLAVAPGRHTLYAGLGNGDIAVIDTAAMTVTSTIASGVASVDLIDYSAATGKVYAGSDEGVSVVDVGGGKVDRRISTAAPVGQPRFDAADGKVYATVPGTDALVQMDPATGYVTRTYTVPKCRANGLAINPSRQLALLTCGSSVAFVNLGSGAQQVTRTVQGGDVATYDARGDVFVVASPHDAKDSTVGVFGGDGHFVGSVASTPNAHAAVYDDAHGVVWAPADAGLMSFAPAQCAPPPDWVRFAGGLSVFAIPLAAFALFLILYARRRRRGPNEPAGPTDRDLREQDLVFERERMRALEDGILGPEG